MLADRIRMRFLNTGPRPEDIADENCRVATDEDFSGTSDGEFKYIGTATSLVIPHEIKGVPVTSYANMFRETTVTEVRSNNPRITNTGSMFMSCSSLTSLDLSNFDTSNITNMGSMFMSCSSLTSLDLSNFDTSNVTNMQGMFMGCSSLTSLDLSNFDTSNVTSISFMFMYCSGLTSLDLSSFDTTKVTMMQLTFGACSSLTSLDLSSFDTTKVASMQQMFDGCNSVTTAYARTQADADKFNASSKKPSGLTFIVKP